MSHSSKATVVLISAAFCFAVGMGISSSARASTSLLATCQKAGSRDFVNTCCQMFIRKHGKPLWMQETGSNCGEAITCTQKVAGAKLCRLRIPDDNRQHSTAPPPPPPPTTQLSDIRLKHNVHRVGSTVFGLGLYDFEYNNQPGLYEGVMAQEVLRVMPQAVVIGPDGYYRVNYGMLGIAMKRLR